VEHALLGAPHNTFLPIMVFLIVIGLHIAPKSITMKMPWGST
jgi:hypothetical protein